MAGNGRIVVVTGVTGRQGGAVARHLLAEGWRVRGVTRSPASRAAQDVAGLGVELAHADMADRHRMTAVCEGAHGVFSVQNPMISGEQGERVQGCNVLDAAADAGVVHVVYGSAGPGEPSSGVAAWDVKLEIAEHARARGLPLTVLRPMAFMELMTDKDLYPPVAAWHLMPRLVGADRPIPWLAADDLGAIAARAFADPGSYVGRDLALAADQRTLSECRGIWRRVTGRNPRRFPMPLWLFEKFVGPDLTRMWRWLATHHVDVDPTETREHHPAAATVEQFLRRRTRHGRSPGLGGSGEWRGRPRPEVGPSGPRRRCTDCSARSVAATARARHTSPCAAVSTSWRDWRSATRPSPGARSAEPQRRPARRCG